MIKKIIIALLLLYKVANVYAVENIAGHSAYISDVRNLSQHDFSLKRNAILKVLNKYESPLSSNVDAFVETCLNYEINCYLLPSISGLESTFGRYVYPGSYNPFGWGSCKIKFKSWDAAIETVAKNLGGNNPTTARYYNGTTTEEKLHHYNGSVVPTYTGEVTEFMKLIEKGA